MTLNKYLPLYIPLLVYLLLQAYFVWHKMIYSVLVLIFGLLLFTAREYAKKSAAKNLDAQNLFVLPLIFCIAVVSFSVLMPYWQINQFLFFFTLVFMYLYLRSVYEFLFAPGHYRTGSLQNFSAYGNFLSLYFISSAAFGLQAFLSASVWMTILALLAAIFAIIYQVFSINNILTKENLLYIIILPLLLIEIAWSISFLSLSFYVLGLIMSISYYVAVGIIRFYLLGALNGKILKTYLIFGLISIFAVIFTARWI